MERSLGLATSTVRPNVSRLASMGVVPEARRTGAAAFLLSHLLEEAKLRMDEAIVLEVFEQNLPALTLYRRNKFRELMRLFGWRRVATTIGLKSADDLEEISLRKATQMEGSVDFPDLPWQISRHAVAKLADARAYRIDNLCVVISNPAATPVRIYALLGYDGSNGTAARDVLAAVLKQFAACEFFAREIFPEQFGPEIFQPLGFVREPLNQFLMRLDLRS
jgi:Acetyltransferase (GNAT) family